MGFGSGLVPEGLGFGLQNRGRLFALDPEHACVLAPGKRPFHTIIPAMLTRDGRPVFCFGVMGGAFQPQGHVQVVSHLLDGLDAQAVGDVPRWRHEGSSQPTGEAMMDGGVVKVEAGMPDDVVAALVKRGHTVERDDQPEHYGGYQGIVVDQLIDPRIVPRIYHGGSESRKDGAALGF
jgi:gamma-glutamyltranspeptidase/glutathione hydrolase